MTVEDSHSDDPTHKMEVAQVIGVNGRVRIDLKGVDVVPEEKMRHDYSVNRHIWSLSRCQGSAKSDQGGSHMHDADIQRASKGRN